MTPLYLTNARTKRLLQNTLSVALGNVEGLGGPIINRLVISWLKITGTADVDDHYPAIVSVWNTDEEDWEDLTDDQLVQDTSGVVLTVGERYLCTLQGNVDNLGLWET